MTVHYTADHEWLRIDGVVPRTEADIRTDSVPDCASFRTALH